MELKTNIDSGDVKISRNADGTETKIESTPKEEELATRVSKVEETKEEPKPTGEEEIKPPEFDYKEIENIKDPEAKAWAEKAYKSFQRGFGQKFEELSKLRKDVESQVKQPEPTTWTPERLQSEMNKPDFVQAAQNVIQTQPPAEEEFSTLSDKEKNKIQGMEKELLALKQQSSLTNMRAQDEQLKVKYADYNSGAIDIITADLLSGKVQATREHLYKAFNFDKAIQKAYDLGKTDKKLDNQEKVTSMSAEGTTAVGDEAVPKIEKGESDRNYFLRLASRRMAQKSDGGQIRK